MTILVRKKMRYFCNLALTIILFTSTLTNFLPFIEAMGAERYDGDQYITQSKLTKQDGTPIYDGDTMKIEEVYYLTYDWEVPDNTFYENDVLTFSIPKEFKIVNQFNFPLFDMDGEEVALASVLGNDSEGYYINMKFTTDYVETHSSVSGSFKMSYKLNQTYVKGDETIKLPLPGGDITVNVPEYNSPGGGGGIGSGDSQKLTKSGKVMDTIKYNPQTGKYDLPQRVVEWEVNIGLGKLMDAIGENNVDQVDRVVIEDSPKDQQIVSMTMYQENWSDDDWGWEKAFFKTIDFDYETIKENTVELRMDPTNTYYNSFSYNIWPYIQQELAYAKKNDSVLDEVAIDYDTEPLELITENTKLHNDATVKIYYKDGSEGEKWTLSESVDWNVAEGEINGKVSDVSFKKVDGDTGEKLQGATFDLYKKGLDGLFTLKKANITSDANGLVTANKLTTGDYYFEETKSPEGYQDPENPKLEFKIETKDLGGSQNIKDLGEVKNFQENSKINISVEKKWDDGKNQDGIRPKNIEVQLYGNNQPVGNPVTLDEQNNWRYTWNELNEKENETIIRYEVREISKVPGYEVEINGNGTNSVVITNKHTPEVIDIKGKKTWNDNNDKQGNRPNEIVVELYANNQLVDSQNTTAQKNWSYEFTNLAKNENGKAIEYTVKEQAVTDYQPEYNGYDITNNYTPELTEFSVKKTWDDKDNQDGIRPQTIQVQLKGNGKSIGNPVTLSEENDWSYTWEKLEKRENGKEINYTVEEVSNLGKYTVEMTKDGNYEAVLTNHYTPEVIEVRGQKTWDDNQDEKGNRPSKIVVELYGDGKLVDKQETNASKNWSYAFTNLPKNDQGNLIHYEVKEQKVEDYEVSYSGFDMTNTYRPDLVAVNVQKTWDDKNNQDGIRPQTIQVQLKGNGKSIGDPVTLNEKNEWSHTWEGLEKRENEQKINYTVEEVSDLGKYTVEMTKAGDYEVVLTNHYTPEVTEVRGQKIWDDNQDEKGNRPNKIVVELYGDGKLVDKQETNALKNWSYSFTNLPKNNQGKLIHYEVKEQDVEDYEVSYSGFDMTNKYNPVPANVSVQKKWNDKDNQDGIRPEEIQVQLKENGKSIGDPVTLNEKNEWSHTWEGLEKRENGQRINYTVEEVSDTGKYKVEVTKENEYQIVLTNNYKPEETEIRGNKIWEDKDDQDGMRPAEIKVHLIANGRLEPVATKTVKPDKNGDWSYEFTNLPKKEKGKDIVYTIKEEAVPDYQFSAEEPKNDNELNIVNTHHVRKTFIDVTKEWRDNEDQDGLRPQSIYVQLLADGEKVGEPVELNDGNHWKYTWKDLDERKSGKVIDYSIEEITIDSAYESSIEKKDDQSFTIVNTHVPEETEIHGTKTWDDNDDEEGQRPDQIVVRLYGDGHEVAKKTVTKEDNWAYSFTNLPKNNKGREISYTVREDAVQDYTPEVNGTDIVNKYTPGETDISVVKKWIDGNNQDGIRPEKILVQLQADGLPIGEPVSLSEQNNWIHKWEGLVARAYGKDIQYTVVEIDVPENYHVEIDDTNKEEIIISNIHVPETIKISGNKYWVDDQNKYNERPDSITVNLMANGEKIASKEVTKNDNWQYEFSDLPKYENGKEIVYTVNENDVPNYTSKIEGFDITNTYTPKDKIPETPSDNGPSRHGTPLVGGTVKGRTLPRTGSKTTQFSNILGVILIIMMLTFAGWFTLCKNS